MLEFLPCTESSTGAAENDCAHKKLHTQPQGITSEAGVQLSLSGQQNLLEVFSELYSSGCEVVSYCDYHVHFQDGMC